MADVQVTHSPQEERYVLTVDGERAGFIDYLDEIEVRVLTHTVVEAEYEGRGYASQLTRFALEDIRNQGRQARAVCSYVAAYIQKHPEYSDLVAVG
ncbi:GNAT family N-acetyltransferase [Tsukamurella soli]|uniref:GNAT family N-acetyltransferase n=1 Tax=Tsukamurella soli TaxID=644556 RepID=A0ABP8J4D2_9ACTN